MAINLGPQSDVLGHLGGFLGGALMMLCLKPNLRQEYRDPLGIENASKTPRKQRKRRGFEGFQA